ncbi:lysophospholipid acyltransferase family protein [Scytonema sp. NUACC26]|uniref:lysophospholipid acyltransferase family protein n=1 Tax=Scytonema sp. NUACC26 TaxID=3140176 RepID=UPI0038B39AA4
MSKRPILGSSIEQENNVEKDDLPPLTFETIQRAREGLAMSRNPAIRKAIQKALKRVTVISEGGSESRASGTTRRFVLRAFIQTLFKVKVENLERLPHGAAVLAANHLNHIDPFLLLSQIPPSPYYYIFGDARTLHNKWWKRQILNFAGGVIPLERRWKEEMAAIEGAKVGREDLHDLAGDKCDRPIIGSAKVGREDLHDLAQAIEQDVPPGNSIPVLRQINSTIQAIFAQNNGILLFAEGRLGTHEGKLHLPLKQGAVIYALKAGVPIVPVGLIGTKNLYLGKELTIRFGEPLYFPQSNRPTRQEVSTALEALQHALISLLPQNYQEPEGLKLFHHFLNQMLC